MLRAGEPAPRCPTNGLLAYLTVLRDIETDGPGRRAPEATRCSGRHRTVWPDEPDAVEFDLAHGDWHPPVPRQRLRGGGPGRSRAPREGAPTRDRWMDPAWAARWPCEEVWKVRKPD